MSDIGYKISRARRALKHEFSMLNLRNPDDVEWRLDQESDESYSWNFEYHGLVFTMTYIFDTRKIVRECQIVEVAA